jgi:lysophospholipase L1-like esterase
MKVVLCYGDSNTWGSTPGSGERYPSEVRWTGVLQNGLGTDFRIIEEGLNGRTTVWDDPFGDNRSGKRLLPPLLETHAPIDLVLIMLGTNDLNHVYGLSAYDIARGAGALVEIVNDSLAGPDGFKPQTLLVAPPHIGQLPEEVAPAFAGAVEKSKEFSRHYKYFADEMGCFFLDASTVIRSSEIDGVHLDAEAHRKLGEAMAGKVNEIFSDVSR